MSELKIVPYDKNLLLDFKYDGIEQEITGQQIFPMIEFYSKLGDVFIGMIENKIIGIGGLYPLWENSGGGFLFLNKETKNHKVSVFKTLLEYMNMLIKQYKIKTLIVECQDDSLQAKSLVTHLGFIRNRQVSMEVYTKKL